MPFLIPRTLAELEQLVAAAESESLHLDFKSSRALSGNKNGFRAELPRDASAFANADGGVLIVGIEEDTNCRASKIAGYQGGDISASWFEDILVNSVSPSIPGVEALRIDTPTGAVFVVHIPASPIAPHQSSSDRKYYARRQFRRDDLEHFEIELLRLRSKSQELGVFGGLAVRGYMLVAEVENSLNNPIYDAKIAFTGATPSILAPMPLFGKGIEIIPARSKIQYQIDSVHGAFADPELRNKLTYSFHFSTMPGGKVDTMPGAINLAALEGSALVEDGMSNLTEIVKDGMKQIAQAIKSKK